MSLQENIKHQITESMQTQQLLLEEQAEVIEFAAQLIVNALLVDKKILTCGNGAAVANAQHFVAIMINRFERERPSLPALSLANDVQLLTAIASSQHYDDMFSKQLRALGQSSDVLLIYNVQDSNLNLVKLISAAHEKGINIILLSGENESSLVTLLRETDICISVPSQSAIRIHEAHLLVTHCLCGLVDAQLFGN